MAAIVGRQHAVPLLVVAAPSPAWASPRGYFAGLERASKVAALDRDYATVPAAVDARRLLSVSSTRQWAVKFPLHQTARGKVLAACMRPDE